MATNNLSLSSRLKLNNDLSIPRIHLGVYLTSGQETIRAVRWALEAGYRGFDSAQKYRNEREVGNSILSWLSDEKSNRKKLKREDIFFTSKLASNTSYEAARKSIKQSVETSGLGYIDLFLLHSPYGGKSSRLASGKAVEDAIADGEVKIGGVSNYGVKHLEELLATKPRVVPAVNQIEVHPFNTRTNIISFCQKNGIVVDVCAACSGTAHETSNHRFTFDEILVHARTANDQMELAARFHSTAKKCHEGKDRSKTGKFHISRLMILT